MKNTFACQLDGERLVVIRFDAGEVRLLMPGANASSSTRSRRRPACATPTATWNSAARAWSCSSTRHGTVTPLASCALVPGSDVAPWPTLPVRRAGADGHAPCAMRRRRRAPSAIGRRRGASSRSRRGSFARKRSEHPPSGTAPDRSPSATAPCPPHLAADAGADGRRHRHPRRRRRAGRDRPVRRRRRSPAAQPADAHRARVLDRRSGVRRRSRAAARPVRHRAARRAGRRAGPPRPPRGR